jgi:hypothetical protein
MSVTICCPTCSRPLRIARAPTTAQQFRCPGCGGVFGISALAPSPPAPVPDLPPRATVKPKEKPPSALPTAAHQSVRSSETKAAPPPPAPRGHFAAGLLLGALGMLTCLTIGGVLYFANRAPQTAATNKDAHAEQIDSPPDQHANNKQTRVEPPPIKEPPPKEDAARLPPLPAQHQSQVDAAVKRGVDFLKQSQADSGSWSDDYRSAGLAALPALTLLECGVPANDSRIVKARQFVRKTSGLLNSTYEIALVLLFLDRCGDKTDNVLMRHLTLRLIAGQTPAGGWSYQCPLVLTKHEKDFLAVLDALRPASHEELFVKPSRDPLPPPPEKDDGAIKSSGGKRPEDLQGKPREAYDALPPRLQHVPSLQPPADAHQLPLADHSDNSNTQFAALGLWAAGRHKLPVERALALTAARFRFSQSINGGWDYPYEVPSHSSTPSMTCAGLLGLALGHGLIVRHQSHPTHSAKVDDAAIQHGMKALAGFIGAPPSHPFPSPPGGRGVRGEGRPSVNLYFLWSLGRVGLLYRTRRIDGKDWYAWGVNQVLVWQETDGSWKANAYADAAPIINTCFALLFLKRSHWTEDASRALDFNLGVRIPLQGGK